MPSSSSLLLLVLSYFIRNENDREQRNLQIQRKHNLCYENHTLCVHVNRFLYLDAMTIQNRIAKTAKFDFPLTCGCENRFIIQMNGLTLYGQAFAGILLIQINHTRTYILTHSRCVPSPILNQSLFHICFYLLNLFSGHRFSFRCCPMLCIYSLCESLTTIKFEMYLNKPCISDCRHYIACFRRWNFC